MIEEAYQSKIDPQQVIACTDGHQKAGREPVQWKASQCNALELEKFLEDVKNGVYPLTAFSVTVIDPHSQTRPRAISPDVAENVKSETPEPAYSETRVVTSMNCHIRECKDEENMLQVICLHYNSFSVHNCHCLLSCNGLFVIP